jgi:hypothetical protein
MRRPDDQPARLTEDPNAPALLADAVRAARGPAPDPNRLASLGVALGFAAPPVFVPPPVAPPAAGAAAAAGAKAALGGVAAGGAKAALAGLAAVGVAAAVAVGGFGVGRDLMTKPPSPGRAVPAAVQRHEARVPEPLEDVALPTEEPAAAPSAAPVPVAEPSTRRRHHTRVAPAVAPAAEESVAAPETPADAASRLREEAALVQRAERLLDSDPARALALTEERRRRFPGGALDQEAEVVAIDALLRLGRRADATVRARTFEAAHAGSVHARRIKRLLAQ